MSDSVPPSVGLDRTALSVVPLSGNSEEMRYWHSRSPAERLRHVQALRRINYGGLADGRMERVLEVVPLPWR